MSERNTRQKKAIREVITEATNPLTAQDIEVRANQLVPGIGIATVYRALKRFQEEGFVTVVEISGESPRYELSDKGHHHHFVCSACGQVYDLEGCSGNVEALAPEGFQVDKHEITLFGLCSGCTS